MINAVNLQSFFTDEDMNLMKKIKLYVEDNWNKCDMVAIFFFIVGVTCRFVVLRASCVWYHVCMIYSVP